MTQDAALAALVADIAAKLDVPEKIPCTPREQAISRAITLLHRLTDEELEYVLEWLETGELPA